MEAMKSTGNILLDGEVEVDEFFVGGPEEGKRGKSPGKKRQVVLAIKVDAYGTQRSYAKVVPSADSIELEAFFDTFISKSALVRTDKWTGYLPLKNDYRGYRTEKIRERENFPVHAPSNNDDQSLAERYPSSMQAPPSLSG
jgi:hypothetical protein